MKNLELSPKGSSIVTEFRKQITLLVKRMDEKKQMDEENQILFTALIKSFTVILQEEYNNFEKISALEKKIEQLEEELEF